MAGHQPIAARLGNQPSWRQEVSMFVSHVSLLAPQVQREATALGMAYHVEPNHPSLRLGIALEWQSPRSGDDVPFAVSVDAASVFRGFGCWEPLLGIEMGYTNANRLEPPTSSWPESITAVRQNRLVPWYVGMLITLLRFRHSRVTVESLSVRWAMMGLDAHMVRVELDLLHAGLTW